MSLPLRLSLRDQQRRILMPPEDEEDRQRAIDAVMKFRFVQDSSRMIDAMGLETSKLVKPIRERGRVNHFFEEWNELYRKKVRSDNP